MPNPGRNPERLRSCARLLARIGPTNRPLVAMHLQLRVNKGLKAGSNENWLRALVRSDEALGGRDFRSLKPADLPAVVAALKAGIGPRTAHLHTMLLRHFLKEVLDVDVLPRDWNRATAMRKPKAIVAGHVVPDSAFQAMMACCADLEPEGSNLVLREKAEAILMTLRHGGWRASELLALNVGDCDFDDGGLWMTLRDEAGDLKTGGRRIYLVAPVPYLKAWLSLHPAGTDREAPLFPGIRSRDGLKRLQYKDLNDLIHKLAEKSGANAGLATNDHITAHDFRHTCATEKARQRWQEAEMRQFFGWSKTSAMPSTYTHLNLEDMRAAVRRDAGLLSSPPNLHHEASNDVAQMLLNALANRLRIPP